MLRLPCGECGAWTALEPGMFEVRCPVHGKHELPVDRCPICGWTIGHDAFLTALRSLSPNWRGPIVLSNN